MDVTSLFFIPKYYLPEEQTYCSCAGWGCSAMNIHIMLSHGNSSLCPSYCTSLHWKQKLSNVLLPSLFTEIINFHMNKDEEAEKKKQQNHSAVCWNSAALYPPAGEHPDLYPQGGNHQPVPCQKGAEGSALGSLSLSQWGCWLCCEVLNSASNEIVHR